MNHAYRIVWSKTSEVWVAISVISRGQGNNTRSKLVAAALMLGGVAVQAGPIGGVVTSGVGSILQSGFPTTIHQCSQNLSLNWKRFNNASTETVTFVQPLGLDVSGYWMYDT